MDKISEATPASAVANKNGKGLLTHSATDSQAQNLLDDIGGSDTQGTTSAEGKRGGEGGNKMQEKEIMSHHVGDDTVDEKKVLDKTKDYLRSLLDISPKTKDSELKKQDPFDIFVNFYNSIKDDENLSIQDKMSRSIKYTVSQTKNAKVQSEFVERKIQEFSVRDKAREAEMMEMKKQLRDNTRQMHAVKTEVNKSLSDLVQYKSCVADLSRLKKKLFHFPLLSNTLREL
ncbi:hypothetical protein QAD02_002327 [Eretmocerus hayati]|uniref:Uncharacterized protein n=1 Tax=Eretmocerus hayati TaxID=131215 RepID=A0ACC2NJJ9_9HYME|nr:hypothetical protein QAD02_002327 [Eretmocerus hayati]